MTTPLQSSPGLFNDAFGALLVRFSGIGLTFAVTTLAARKLGPGEYGMYHAALSFAVLLATIAPLGSDRLAARNLSSISNVLQAGREVSLAHRCALFSSVFVMLAAGGLLLIFHMTDSSAEWQQIVLLTVLMFIPLSLTYLRQWIAIPLVGARRATAAEQTILPLLFLLVILLAAWFRVRLTAVSASVTYAALAMLVWGGAISRGVYRSLLQSAVRCRVQQSDVRERLLSGMPFVGVSLGGVMMNRAMPLVVASVVGFEDSARFAVALQFAALPGIPLGIANLCMIPRCSRHFQLGQHRDAEHIIRQSATVAFGVSISIAVLAWLLSPLFVLLLGKSYQGIPEILPVLLSVAVIEAAAGPLIAVLQAAQLEVIYSKVTLAFIPVQLGLIGVIGHYGGIAGAAVAYLVSRSLWNLLLLLIVYRQRGIRSFPYGHIRHFRTLPRAA